MVDSTFSKSKENKSCTFVPSHKIQNKPLTASIDCICVPKVKEKICRCISLANQGTGHLSHKFVKPSGATALIAYVRTNGSDPSLKEQVKLIYEFCLEHNFQVTKIYEDHGKPSFGLDEALSCLDEVDGLIAVDLDRFVEHSADRLRDLRPFIHHFFCHTNKHLITLKEGIHTGSLGGQVSAMEIINQTKDNL